MMTIFFPDPANISVSYLGSYYHYDKVVTIEFIINNLLKITRADGDTFDYVRGTSITVRGFHTITDAK